jgi:cytosine/adenosine deaminase-related metal-dependent hydrolase
MSLGESDGGLPPDSVVEDIDVILEDSARAIEAFHQAGPGAMTSVVLAPCSPFSVDGDLMKATSDLARERGVMMHTHLAETADEQQFCLGRFGRRPVEYMEDLGWAGQDVWYAHAVHVAEDEVARMGEAGTAVAHCPTSNMRLASGMAPVSGYLEAGVRVGLGVDGSASNDSSHMLGEARQALLLNRLATAPGVGRGEQMTARSALALATAGGASVLGRDDVGRLGPGLAADFIAIDFDRIEFAGAIHDPVAAVIMCSPARVDHSWVAGRRVVEGGRLVGVEVEPLVEEHNRLAAALFG